jgi:hypothetical protein
VLERGLRDLPGAWPTTSSRTPRVRPRQHRRGRHTLIEAFVLVIIVVFLFLGNARATLIPLIAVPVALIGTFAVMLALGFSANTVSLLALVLAIGIVVDDAIVVVEAVEAKLEAKPGFPGRGGQGRDGRDHRGHHRHHPGAALGLRAGRLHPRHLGPALPAVRGRGLGLDGDLGDQRADPLARALRDPAQAASRAAKGVLGWISRGSTGRATAMPSSPARSRGGPCSASCCSAGPSSLTGGLFRAVPTGFLPSEDQGAFIVETRLPEAPR